MPRNRPTSWRRRWDRWRRLTPSERALLLHFIATLPLCAALLRMFSLRRTLTLLMWVTRPRRLPHSFADPAHTVEALRHDAQILALAAAVIPLHMTCLPRSVTFWWYGYRCGVTCDLRLGVRRAGVPFQAHAWVEYNGAVVNDDPSIATRFSVIAAADHLWSSTRFD